MSALAKKPLQVYLRRDQVEPLRSLAQRRKTPMAELVRQGVDRVLAEVPVEEDPLWDIVGLGDSGLGDLSIEHDRYLTEWETEANQTWTKRSS